MNWIIAKKKHSENVIKVEIKAPEIVSVTKPGQFVTIKIYQESEPIPLVISEVNQNNGTISLFLDTFGLSHQKLIGLTVGDELFEVLGPLGVPVEIKKYGTVVCAAGGIGIIPMYSVARAIKSAGNKVIVVLGASSADHLFLEEDMARIADELIIMTEDGSFGRKGMVTDVMRELLIRDTIDLVITSGPVKMIKQSSALTHMYTIPIVATLYSLNSKGDGIGDIYRVSVCPGSKYICVDGIDFNAFYPDFETMLTRMEKRFSDHQSFYQSSMKMQLIPD